MEALGAGSARGHPAKAGSGQGIGHATCSQSLVKPGLMARAPPYGQAKPSPRPSRSSVPVPRGHGARLVHLNHSTANAGTSSLSR